MNQDPAARKGNMPPRMSLHSKIKEKVYKALTESGRDTTDPIYVAYDSESAEYSILGSDHVVLRNSFSEDDPTIPYPVIYTKIQLYKDGQLHNPVDGNDMPGYLVVTSDEMTPKIVTEHDATKAIYIPAINAEFFVHELTDAEAEMLSGMIEVATASVPAPHS